MMLPSIDDTLTEEQQDEIMEAWFFKCSREERGALVRLVMKLFDLFLENESKSKCQ